MANEAVIVLPTIREESFNKWVKQWDEKLLGKADVIVVEDNPEKSFGVPDGYKHYSWKEIDESLGEKSWIIPRRTDCVRSYGFYKAYKAGYKYIISLDDDCYPDEPDLVDTHVSTLKSATPRWVNSVTGVKVRGIPYQNLGSREIVISHGLWRGVPDLDAPTQLVTPTPEVNAVEWAPVPVGQYYPMCGMNVAFKKEVIPAMYFLLMGGDYEYDRLGDIWSGVMTKKIADHLGVSVYSGVPYINHSRASNVYTNLKKEAPGFEINEEFWQKVDSVRLTKTTWKDCYIELAEKLPLNDTYFKKLRLAMKTWAELF